MATIRPQLTSSWLQSRLVADTALTALVGTRIYKSLAPDELGSGGTLTDVYVVHDFVTGDFEHIALTSLGAAVQAVTRRQVKVVGKGRDGLRLLPVVDRIHALGGVQGDLSGHHFSVEEPTALIDYLETADGHHWTHLGAQFDITVHTT